MEVVEHLFHLQDYDFPVTCNKSPFGDPSSSLLYKTVEKELEKEKKKK